MTCRASLSLSAFAGFVIADGDGPPLSALHAESFEIGRLVPLLIPEPGRDMRRQVTPEDAAAVAHRLLPLVLSYGVTELVCEWNTSRTSPFHRVSSAVREMCEANGIAFRHVHKWRVYLAADHRAWVARRLANGYAGFPADAYEVTRNAGAMLLEQLERDRPVQLAPPWIRGGAGLAGTGAGTSPAEIEGALVVSLADVSEGTSSKEASHAPRATENGAPATAGGKTIAGPPPRPVLGPGDRIAGLDPGSAFAGLVVSEGTAAPLRAVHRESIPTGAHVALATPQKRKRADGSEWMQTTRLSFTAEHVERAADRILETLLDLEVRVLVIEHVDSAWLPRNVTPGAARSRMLELNRSSWLGGVVGDRAARAGIHVERVSQASWRAVVAGKGPKGGGGAERIPAAVAAGYAGWDGGSDDHERDAAGLCLWYVAPVEVEAPRAPRERARSAPAERKPRRRSVAAVERERERRAAERAASGCTCGSTRRHRRECPAAKVGGKLRTEWMKGRDG